MHIITSIYPDNYELQTKTINSWLSNDFAIISLNPPHEILQLKNRFPHVRFGPIPGDMPTVDDILNSIPRNENFGITNSDILFTVHRKKIELLLGIGDKLLFGQRVNVPDLSIREGQFFDVGFDYFFLNSKYRSLFPPSIFKFGRPAWDYWIPLIYLKNKIPIILIKDRIAFHQFHKPRWDGSLWDQYINELCKYSGLRIDATLHLIIDNSEKMDKIC